MKNPALLSGKEVIENYEITPHDLFLLIKEQGLRPCSEIGERLENPQDAKREFRKCAVERLKQELAKRHFVDRLIGYWKLKEKITSLQKEISSIERFKNNEDSQWEWKFMPWKIFSSDSAVHELLGYFFKKKDVIELLGLSRDFEKTEAQDRGKDTGKKGAQFGLSEDSGEKGPISIVVHNQQHGITGHQINTASKQSLEKMTPEEVRRQGLQDDTEKHSADKIGAAIYGIELCVFLEREGKQMIKGEFESLLSKKFPNLPFKYITDIWSEIKKTKYGKCLKGPGRPTRQNKEEDE